MVVYPHPPTEVPSGQARCRVVIERSDPISITSTLIVPSNSDGTETWVIGTNFTFDGNVPVGGIMTPAHFAQRRGSSNSNTRVCRPCSHGSLLSRHNLTEMTPAP